MITLEQLTDVLQTASVTLLIVTCILLIRHSRQGRHLWLGVGFAWALVSYLIVSSGVVTQVPVLFMFFVTGGIMSPVFFWLLTRAIFDDHFQIASSDAAWFVLMFITNIQYYFISTPRLPEWFATSMLMVGHVTSVVFVLAALYTAIKTRQGDLVESRLHFRNIFIIVTASVIVATLVAEMIKADQQAELLIKILQRVSVLFITTVFLANNFSIKSGFFFKEIPKPKAVVSDDPALKALLLNFLSQKIYTREGLTIRLLAEAMNVQEYRLRKVINGQLGFKNFNDFLNQYRIQEACEILSDKAQNQKTIQEISYQLGYQSIGPFNKAFKELKGVTPTIFRKSSAA